MFRFLAASAGLALAILPANAQSLDAFTPGPVIAGHGTSIAIDSDMPIPVGTVFRIDFDIAKAATPGEVSRALDTPARFINMHVRAGVPVENIHVALVVHGGAYADLLTDAAYARIHPDAGGNASRELVEALLASGAQIWLCGQTAAAYGITREDLIPGVQMSLSAMTAHALLQQEGYTLNPF